MNILIVDGNEQEASNIYTNMGMDTQFEVYKKVLENLSQNNETLNSEAVAEESTNDNKTNANTENVKSFSDDDLPF